MFPSNVLPNNKISLNFKINFGSLNSSHRGLRGPKFPESHTSDFQACKSHVTLLRVNIKEIYINISSHILTRKPVSVHHCKRGFTSKLHLINTQRYATRPFSIPGVAMLDGRFILATSAIYLITVVPAHQLGLT